MKTPNKRNYIRWMKIILFIEKYTPKNISYATDTSLPSVYKNFKWFEKKGWVIIKPDGRKNSITLTKLGKEVQDACYIILKHIDELKIDSTYMRHTGGGRLYEKF
jgi:predicted transcriptional regulator